jgi:thiaminase
MEELAQRMAPTESTLVDLSRCFNIATRMEAAFFMQSMREEVVKGSA